VDDARLGTMIGAILLPVKEIYEERCGKCGLLDHSTTAYTTLEYDEVWEFHPPGEIRVHCF
jgi:hypothetical protein